jgi:hypothetical protein
MVCTRHAIGLQVMHEGSPNVFMGSVHDVMLLMAQLARPSRMKSVFGRECRSQHANSAVFCAKPRKAWTEAIHMVV